jgi:hypothetical protein
MLLTLSCNDRMHVEEITRDDDSARQFIPCALKTRLVNNLYLFYMRERAGSLVPAHFDIAICDCSLQGLSFAAISTSTLCCLRA